MAGRPSFGLILPHWSKGFGGATPTAAEVVELGVFAERAGFESLWLVDHFRWEPYVDAPELGHSLSEETKGRQVGAWECWALLAALASATERAELGTVVTNVGYRNPGLLAQMANTVDSLSGGRLVLGVGAGDYVSEHRMHGFVWENRVGRFEEALKIIRPMLRGETVAFEGEHLRAEGASLGIAGPRPGGPPLMIGLLKGKPRMQRLVAQHADEWNAWLAFGESSPAAYAALVGPMEEACRRHGRDPATLRRHVSLGALMPGHQFRRGESVPLSGSPREVAEQLGAFGELGVDRVSFFLMPGTRAGVEWLAEAVSIARG